MIALVLSRRLDIKNENTPLGNDCRGLTSHPVLFDWILDLKKKFHYIWVILYQYLFQKVVLKTLPDSSIQSPFFLFTIGGELSCDLRTLALPLVSNKLCKKNYGALASTQICAGVPEGGLDSCQVWIQDTEYCL